MTDRADQLKSCKPDLFADVYLYPPELGGRDDPILPGFGCPIVISNQPPWVGWDGWALLGDDALFPGHRRRLGFLFLTSAGRDAIKQAGRFYLWELGIIGEGSVIDDLGA